MISEYHQRQYEQLDNALTRVGTGKGPLNGGLEALARVLSVFTTSSTMTHRR